MFIYCSAFAHVINCLLKVSKNNVYYFLNIFSVPDHLADLICPQR